MSGKPDSTGGGDPVGDPVCDHCGEPARWRHGEHAFCCSGCESAYAWIAESGLTDYYALRDSLGQEGRQVVAVSASEDSHLDDPVYLASLGHRPGEATLHITGLHCAACVWLIEAMPRKIPGLLFTRVEFNAGRVHLRWDPQVVSLATIAHAWRRLGYTLQANDEAAQRAAKKQRQRDLLRMSLSGAFAGNTMLVTFALYAGDSTGMEPHFYRLFSWASAALALPNVTYGAWPFFRAAINNLRLGRLHLDLPIALGITAAYGASFYALLRGAHTLYFDSVAMLVFLLLVGRFIASRGQLWALSQTAALNLLLPPNAHRRDPQRPDEWHTIATTKLQIGDRIRVLAGERFPADGQICGGTTFVDASTLTGEAQPLALGLGESALAGTTNLQHTVELVVHALGKDTRIGSLAQQLSHDAPAKSATESLVDRLSGIFVVTVISLAALGGCMWWWMDPSRIFDVVLAVLVVTCPCALGMATPLALACTRAEAARHGFILARANALEDLVAVQTIAFDKTGTLTHGRMDVAQIWSHTPSHQLAGIVQALESQSAHPIARSLLRWTSTCSPLSMHIENLHELAGRGISGTIDGTTYRLGRYDDAEFRTKHADFAFRSEAARACANGQSVIYLEDANGMIAAFALADTLREGVPAMLDGLRHLGLQLAMVSGDHPDTVQALATKLGITQAKGALIPEEKMQMLERLAPCAMVGDGVNDAPALRHAAVGIAIGGAAQIAMRVADIYIPNGDVRAIPTLWRGALRGRAVIRRNLGFALLYNAVFVSAALMDMIDPLAAAILMPLSSLTVIASSLRARPFGARKKAASSATSTNGVASTTNFSKPLPA